MVLAQLASSPAEACTREGETGLGRLAVLPATGSTASPNTWISVPSRNGEPGTTPELEASDVAITRAGQPISATANKIVVGGELETALWVFVPTELLPEGASIEVKLRGEIVSQFVVAGGPDLTAPAAPVITKVIVNSAYFGAWSCGQASDVTVAVAESQDLLLLVQDADAGLPEFALAIATGDQIRAVDVPAGVQTLHLLAMDLAGNMSAATAVPPLTVPETVSGCSVAPHDGDASAVLWFLVAILGPSLGPLQRRHRHRRRHPIDLPHRHKLTE